MESATRAFEAGLVGGPGELYLAGRHIDLRTAQEHRLGYVTTDSTPGYERFKGMLAIPNICARGTVVSLKFRHIDHDEHERKYDQPAGQVLRLFNTRALLAETDTIVVTEGEMDTITLTGLGIPAVSVPSGANSWNAKRHWRLLEGYRRVVLFRDNDEAGGELVKKVLDTDLPVQVVAPPHGFKDLNEAHTNGLDAEIIALVNGETK